MRWKLFTRQQDWWTVQWFKCSWTDSQNRVETKTWYICSFDKNRLKNRLYPLQVYIALLILVPSCPEAITPSGFFVAVVKPQIFPWPGRGNRLLVEVQHIIYCSFVHATGVADDAISLNVVCWRVSSVVRRNQKCSKIPLPVLVVNFYVSDLSLIFSISCDI